MSRRESREESDPERLGKLIEPVLRELKIIGRRIGRDLHEAWMEVAGPDLSGRTRLKSFKGGKLYVEVDSSALLHELQSFHGPDLLARLRERMPKPHVASLRFRLGTFGSTEERGQSPDRSAG
jgi:predicted nucleic acid-binding Zn ribbon protein